MASVLTLECRKQSSGFSRLISNGRAPAGRGLVFAASSFPPSAQGAPCPRQVERGSHSSVLTSLVPTCPPPLPRANTTLLQEEDDYDVMQDPEFLQSVLENLPGVDPNNEAIRNAMGSLASQATKEGKKDKKEEDKK